MRRPRLTYANVASTLALVVALSGGAVAATQISGTTIQDRTVGHRKIVLDTLTGAEISESSLGKVPDANLLDGRDSTGFLAASAMRRFGPVSVSPCDCTEARSLITIGQLTFSGACVSNGQQVLHLEITSSVAHASYADLTQVGAGTTYGNGDMAAGARNLLASVITQSAPVTIFTPVTGSAVSADGHAVSYNLYMGQNLGAATDGTCVFGGSFLVR